MTKRRSGLGGERLFGDNDLSDEEANFVAIPRIAALAAALLIPATAVLAQTAGAATPAPAVAAPTPSGPLRTVQNERDPDQMICKRQELASSRLLGQKICHTRADWDNITRNSRDAIDTVQRKSKFGF